MNLQPLGPKPSALPSWATSRKNGALEGIRTPDLLVRSQTLYPAELRAHDHTRSNNNQYWWLQRESNQRHEDFQSSALPTELWSHIWRSQRDSNPRSSAWQADVLTSCTKRPYGCGNRIWTCGLWVMSPTSYQTALSRDIVGGGKGIRTPAPLARPPGFQDRSLQPDLGIPPYGA